MVFDFVRAPVLRKILENKVLPSIATQVREAHGITVTWESAVIDTLMDLGGNDVASGGRGMGNLAEAAVLNPLARVLFEMMAEGEGARNLVIEDVIIPRDGDGRYELQWRADGVALGK